uniref:Uncharacterized protein n=1 Tax=Manihot esculenta TaxID=3983 RepID=A0A2C9W9V2_MANES
MTINALVAATLPHPYLATPLFLSLSEPVLSTGVAAASK